MDESILFFVLVGFVAQMIDGALGMAYGVSSNALLLGFGLPPAAASASVHMAEVVTTGVSGISHHLFGNIDRKVIKSLVLPGVIGGVAGAYLLTTIPVDIIKPVVSVYLVTMGIVILMKGFLKPAVTPAETPLIPLGLAGGFLDAIGGGGWGPVVTTTLVARGNLPRYTVGSVNAAEFFVATAQSITFILTIGITHWQIVLGLLIGGAAAAPLAAYAARRLPARLMMNMVGVLIILISLRTLILSFQ